MSGNYSLVGRGWVRFRIMRTATLDVLTPRNEVLRTLSKNVGRSRGPVRAVNPFGG